MKKMFLFVLFLILLGSIAIAIPGIPNKFVGTVTFSDGAAPDGLMVTAKIDNEAVASGQTLNGRYSLKINDPDNDKKDKTIYFFVEELQANEQAVFVNGEETELDLTFDEQIPSSYCGDDTCDEGECAAGCIDCSVEDCCVNNNCDPIEDCATCQEDCGICIDTDGDFILDDGDDSGVIGDNHCNGGETEDCDDNCLYVANSEQEDLDNDGIGNICDYDNDNDGINDTEDHLFGHLENIATNFDPLEILIDGSSDLDQVFSGVQTVEFKSDENTIVTFEFNFDLHTLNLPAIKIEKQTGSDAGSLIVSGILTIEGTKTVQLDNLANKGEICIRDAEIASIDEITANCDGDNELLLNCDNTTQDEYTCINEGTYYQVTGLKNSGIKEYTAPTSGDDTTGDTGGNTGGGGGGGGGSCKANYVCEPISSCSSAGKRTEVCTDSKCNKGSYRQTVSCIFVLPPQITLNVEEEPEESEEGTGLETAPADTTEETTTERTGFAAVTGAVIGLFTEKGNAGVGFSIIAGIIVLGVAVYFFINKRKKSKKD